MVEDYITLRLYKDAEYTPPCARLPQSGLPGFWEALGVSEDAEEKLQPEWQKGNWIPVSPDYPLISRLIQVQVDNATLKADTVCDLLLEIERGRKHCKEASCFVIFDELTKAAKLALAAGQSILLSPFE